MRISVLTASMAITPALHAQGAATWLWDVTTQNGDSVVEPGETALVTLSLLMASDIYDMDQIALNRTVHDTLGGKGADLGTIVEWKVLNNLADQGDFTTTDGVSLFNTEAFQVDIQGPFVEDNPIDVLQFEWAPDVYSEYTVEYDTFSHLTPEFEQFVLVLIAPDGGNYDQSETWPVSEAAIMFQVAPSPGAASILAFAAMSLAASRRR